jgi:hypothetical protein
MDNLLTSERIPSQLMKGRYGSFLSDVSSFGDSLLGTLVDLQPNPLHHSST